MFAPVVQARPAMSSRSNPTARLCDVLSGNPATTATFEDFRKFLADTEHSSENLEFHLWFSNFEKRYFTIMKGGPAGFVPLKPPPVVNLLSLKSNAREGYDLFLEVPIHLHKLLSSESRKLKNLLSFKKKHKIDFSCPTELPFSEEITIIVKLFLDSSSSLELNIPGKMRDKALSLLKTTTHPDSLRPVFEHIDQLLVASWNSFIGKYPNAGVQSSYSR
ncbi:hypothetical protein DSO57_1016789 [Entomophthora muscae]|uniref:Uncharacterized protein n=1 Tax=Entomophthora muscae TaxID=34485 RepID=A0ACC2SUA6_9FUNG|nr:hypothetical protein DSO57_1016789 [Entomophthora muscae]